MIVIHTNALVILAKKPHLGKTKTRVAKDTNEKFAQKLSIACIKDLIKNVGKSDTYKPYVATNTKRDKEWFVSNFNVNTFTIPKSKRVTTSSVLKYVFDKLRNKHTNVILIPMDIPYITDKYLTSVFNKLSQYDLIVGPTPDGGVHLIALNKKVKVDNVFEKVNWGISSCEDILGNYDGKKTKLQEMEDLDHYEDLFKQKLEIQKRCPNLYNLLLKEEVFNDDQ